MADDYEECHWQSGFPIYDRTSSCITLPEHHSALSLLHQLDHTWFRDNVLSAPSFRSCLPFRPPSPPPQFPSSSPQREPFRSIELAQFSNSRSFEPRRSISSELPCAHFEKVQRRRVAEKGLDSCHSYRSSYRRPRKQPGEIRTRQRPPNETGTAVTVQAPISDPVRVLRRNGNCESSFYKGKVVVEEARSPNLETITSGKYLRPSLTESQQQEISVKRWLRRERRRISKSLTDLDVDELQGFMDLGFHFSKDELTPRVVNMFPALQRQQREQVEGGRTPEVTTLETKPFWSESWWIQRPASPLHSWRIPAQAEGPEDMKEHLKFWARAVASTVRQEC